MGKNILQLTANALLIKVFYLCVHTWANVYVSKLTYNVNAY